MAYTKLGAAPIGGGQVRSRFAVALGALLLMLSPGGDSAQQEQQGPKYDSPIVCDPVPCLVQKQDLRSLTRTRMVRPWVEGDPVIVVSDLKGRLAPGGSSEHSDPPSVSDPADPAAATQSDPKEPVVREPRGAKKPTRSARELSESRPARVFREGEPLRVIEDLRVVEPALAMPTIVADFEGIPATGSLPPDTVGDVGPNHYVQMVNTAFSVFDKTGALLVGPSPINALWSGFGGACETENHGDPIANYDHLADRWLLAQFSLPGPDFHQCFAISQGPDPTLGYFLYDFPTEDASGNPVFPDYPKIGVWPDGYYMCTQRGFPNGGLDVWVFERDRMLNGDPARAVQFHVPGTSLFLLPSDLDGPPPPPGTPNFFARQVDGERFGGSDRVEVFAFAVDWNNPTASTFTQVATLPTNAFDSVLCSPDLLGACVPQPGTARRLETLTVWPMWRLQYRNFGTHDTLVFNHTIDLGGDVAGIRWYEMRRAGGANWSIFQQGDHGGGELHRWMGSAAMDECGAIAVGYSVSSASEHPGIRFASRLETDPPGTLAQGEVTLVTGGGSQTHSSSRWGNYSSMNLDPVDPSTFWYTTLYYDQTSSGGWRTRVSSFSLPSCDGPNGGGGEPGFEYAAKFVCGLQKDPQGFRLARGYYTSAINIHNPGRERVPLRKKLALTFPPEEDRPGRILPLPDAVLEYDEAMEVDCEEIARALEENDIQTPYSKGFVVIQSPASLDVTAVYTVASLNENGEIAGASSIDVEQIKERRTAGAGAADLLPVPDENGFFCRRVDDRLQVVIRNQGSVRAEASQTEVDFFTHGRSSLPTPALDPGDSVQLAFPIPAGAFDPDADFRISADVGDAVPESDESNNQAGDRCLG